jgi:hypothetical protein
MLDKILIDFITSDKYTVRTEYINKYLQMKIHIIQQLNVPDPENNTFYLIYSSSCIDFVKHNIRSYRVIAPWLLNSIFLYGSMFAPIALSKRVKCLINENINIVDKTRLLDPNYKNGLFNLSCYSNENNINVETASHNNKIYYNKTISQPNNWGIGIENELMVYSDSFVLFNKSLGYDYKTDYIADGTYADIKNLKFGLYKTYQMISIPEYLWIHRPNGINLKRSLKESIEKNSIVQELSNTSSKNCGSHEPININGYSGRNCNVEFVTRDFYQKSLNDSITQLINTRQTFLKYINLPNKTYKITENAAYPYTIFPDDPTKLIYEKMSSYHFNITLPNINNLPNNDFIKLHVEYARLIQLFEPYLVAMFGTPDYNSVDPRCQKYYLTKASYRLFNNIYANIGTADLSHNVPNSRQTSSLGTWIHTVSDTPYNMNRFVNAIGLDFRRDVSKSSADNRFGFEIRFFDNFPINDLYECLSFILYLADISSDEYIVNKLSSLSLHSNITFQNAIITIMQRGSLYVPFSHALTYDNWIVDIVRTTIIKHKQHLINNFDAKLNILKAKKSILPEYMQLYYSFFIKLFGTRGATSRYFIQQLPKEKLPCPNRTFLFDACCSSGELLYTYMLQDFDNSQLSCMQKIFKEEMNKIQYKNQTERFDEPYYNTLQQLPNFIDAIAYKNDKNTPTDYFPHSLIVIHLNAIPSHNNRNKYGNFICHNNADIISIAQKIQDTKMINFGVLILFKIRNTNINNSMFHLNFKYKLYQVIGNQTKFIATNISLNFLKEASTFDILSQPINTITLNDDPVSSHIIQMLINNNIV